MKSQMKPQNKFIAITPTESWMTYEKTWEGVVNSVNKDDPGTVLVYEFMGILAHPEGYIFKPVKEKK